MSFRFTDRSDDLDIETTNGLSCACGTGLDCPYHGQTFGIAISDYDGDGSLDLYVNHHSVPPSELIGAFAMPNADHSFLFSSGEPNSGRRFDKHGVIFFDIDQDGDLDIVETRGGASGTANNPDNQALWNEIYENDGGVIAASGLAEALGVEHPNARGRMFTPINVDGTLALFFGSQQRDDGQFISEFQRYSPGDGYISWSLLGSPEALNGAAFAIGLHIDGDKFTDIALINGSRLTIYPDVGQATGTAQTIQFDDNPERDVIADIVGGDFDGDLDSELYVALTGSKSDRIIDLRNNGTLRDISDSTGIGSEVFGSRSVTAGDFDNDGDLDLAVLRAGDGVRVVFWVNDGEGNFTRENWDLPDTKGQADRIVSGDFDNDGWLDLLVATGKGLHWENVNADPDNVAGGAYYWLQRTPGDNNWINITLQGVDTETSGLGARVFVYTPDGKVQMREQDSGARLHVQDSPRLHFGLGDQTEISKIEVIWADGSKSVYQDIDGSQIGANQFITLTEVTGAQSGTDGNDNIVGANASDTLLGLLGNDTLDGDAARDTLDGGRGDDSLLGGKGYDRIEGGEGDDTADGGFGNDFVLLGSGNDLFIDNQQSSIHGADSVFGEGGDDTLLGAGGRDSLVGGAGNDSIEGGNQYDTLIGGLGDDTISGGFGQDLVLLGDGDDVFLDEGQSNAFGADSVLGGDGDDTITSKGGDDTLNGGAGRDQLTSGNGSTVFILDVLPTAGNDYDIIDGFTSGTDVLMLDKSVFSSLTVGPLPPAEFTNGQPQTASHHIVFQSANGILSYDPDGNGPAGATVIAEVTGQVTLLASDIIVF